MHEHNIRAAIDRHWAASAAGDQVGEHEIYHDDVVCEYPQSGEIIYGRRNLEALRSHHPDKPSEFTVRRIVGEDNLWVSEYVINYGGRRLFTVSVMEFRDGKVSHETQYFADSLMLLPGAPNGSRARRDSPRHSPNARKGTHATSGFQRSDVR